MNPKKVSDSLTEQTYLLMPKHSNGYGKLFGGQLMQWIDEIAALVAIRHCQSEVTTAAIDNLNFKESAKIGDMIVLIARLTYVGRTSMEVRVDTYVEELDGKRKMINKAYLVLVAIDHEHHPCPVPPLELVEERDHAEWESGIKRNALRKERRVEGY